ncbi:hypothetical protein MHBO_000452 [Bonamia ostreae]|uniref:Raptor N-terminal CASPase-like domain-containing protein n=1 Tax=Bonamia ostreae TaxID=126728 RepID=A0ABV2AGH2_9EUKA
MSGIRNIFVSPFNSNRHHFMSKKQADQDTYVPLIQSDKAKLIIVLFEDSKSTPKTFEENVSEANSDKAKELEKRYSAIFDKNEIFFVYEPTVSKFQDAVSKHSENSNRTDCLTIHYLAPRVSPNFRKERHKLYFRNRSSFSSLSVRELRKFVKSQLILIIEPGTFAEWIENSKEENTVFVCPPNKNPTNNCLSILPKQFFSECFQNPALTAIKWSLRASKLLKKESLKLSKLVCNSNFLKEIDLVLETVLDCVVFDLWPKESYIVLMKTNTKTSKIVKSAMLVQLLCKSVSCKPLFFPILPQITNHSFWDIFHLFIENSFYVLNNDDLNYSILETFNHQNLISFENYLCLNFSSKKPKLLPALQKVAIKK